MDNTRPPINLHQMVLDRVEEHLAIQLETAVTQVRGEAPSKEMSAISNVLSYPPIAYLTQSPEYISDIEKLDDGSRNWIVNFVNYVTMDWTMMIRTINGDEDYVDSFINAFEKSIDAVIGTNIAMEGYNDRLDRSHVQDPVALTYYMLATSYRRIALKLGIANGRTASKPTD